MVVELTLANLPEDVTLCRTTASWGQADHVWQVLVDADADAGSGDPGGFDLALLAYTVPQPEFCFPQSAALATSLGAEVLAWNAVTQAWDSLVGADLEVSADPPSDTMRFKLAGAVLDDLGVDDRSLLVPGAGSGYEGESGAAFASDQADPLDLTERPATVDPAGDLANCGAGCDVDDPAFAMADLVGARLSSDLPLSPRFGDATATFEVTVAAMPEQVAGCPDGFDLGVRLREYAWSLWIDIDGNPATGPSVAALQGVEFVALMGTPTREQACLPADLLLSELEVLFAQWDASLGEFREISMPSRLRVDTAAGTLLLELDRGRGVLRHLGEGSRLGLSSDGLTVSEDAGEVVIDAIGDLLDSPLFFVALSGQQTTDSPGDVSCSQCDIAGQPALMLDLQGFRAALQDPSPLDPRLFGNGFE